MRFCNLSVIFIIKYRFYIMAFKVIHPHTSTGTTETIKTRIGKGEIAIQHPAAGDASLFTIDANGDAVEFISGAAVDKKIGNKNVSATGDTYVSATASANKVAVAATDALKTAVSHANSAVQSVNGVAGTAVKLTKANIGLENVNNTADSDKKVAQWVNPITLTVASGATGSVHFDGSGDVTLNVNIEKVPAKAVSGVLSIDNIPKAAIERLFIAETVTDALALTMEEGDTVKITGEHNRMYFCVNAKATTFAEKFTEYTASTHWDAIQGKPATFTPSTHSHESSDISSMAGYSKATAVTPIVVGDTLNTAIGKLEKALEGKMPSGTSVVNKISGLNGEVTIKAGSNINVTTASTSTEKSITIANTYSYTHPATHPASMITGLATVATSGSYNDLKDKPTIDNTHHQAKNVVCAATTGQTAAAAANGNVHLNLVENNAVRSSINIKGTGSATVTSDASGNITISATDTDTHTTETGHYAPTGTTGTVTQTAGNAVAWSGKVITGITLDSKKHVTGITTGTIPANPNTDTHWTSKNIVGASKTATGNAAVTTNGVFLNHLENTTVTSAHGITGAGSVKVTSDASGNITITGTDTDTNHNTTNEAGHYIPSGTTGTVTQTAGTAVAWSGKVITGITLDSKKHVTGITTGAIPANPNTDSKVEDTPSTEVAFILGHKSQSSTAAALSNAGAYMQNGILYSQSVPVLTCTFDGKVSPSGLTDRDVILDCGTF